jgi:hypothetical protein
MNTIKATELRIGNLVQRPEKLRIDVLDGGVIYFGVNILMLCDCERYGKNWAFEPIPIAEEWLVKFGFEKKSFKTKSYSIEVFFYQKVDFVVYILDDCRFEVEIITGQEQFNLYRQWDFVHQLQNLYFALTGTELTLPSK